MKNQFGVSEVNAVMQERGITRKSAIRWLTKHTAKSASKLKATANLATAAVAPAQDVKMAAANDKPEAVPVIKAKPKPQTDAGKARSVGIQDFILAGRPSKQDFVAVYGPTGPRLTWVQRAALGVDAAGFQKALKAGKCVASVAK